MVDYALYVFLAALFSVSPGLVYPTISNRDCCHTVDYWDLLSLLHCSPLLTLFCLCWGRKLQYRPSLNHWYPLSTIISHSMNCMPSSTTTNWRTSEQSCVVASQFTCWSKFQARERMEQRVGKHSWTGLRWWGSYIVVLVNGLTHYVYVPMFSITLINLEMLVAITNIVYKFT